MILVTGATGNIGRSLLEELRAYGSEPVRALTRDISGAGFPAGVEAVAGDLSDIPALPTVLDGVRALFLVPRLGTDGEILDAARAAGVEHVVLVSSITVHTHPHLGPAAENASVEKLLEASGMDWTTLRPTQFASNALMWASTIQARQPVRLPYADTELPTVHPADIASVARVALTEPGHRGQRYALTGPAPISARQQIDTIASLLRRDIDLIEITPAQARPAMVEVFGEDAADAVLDVTGGDINDELRRVRDTISHITGSPARTFADWAAENIDAFR
ncbi:SDR family oxidoreductase [Nocardia sp. NPDC050406]|uniref:SDR family oxidoreductase n=1 Tax=Nocardia sp. NPDC050406 TaxID=3364318 RepID=UPI0037B71F6C